MRLMCLLFLVCSLSSCSTSFSKINSKGGIKNINDLYRIDGKYRNAQDSNKTFTLERILLQGTEPRLEGDENSTILIKVIKKNRIEIELHKGDEILERKVIKGKIKNDYFWVRRRISFKNKYILFNYFGSDRFRIGIRNNDRIIIDIDSLGCGCLILIPFLCSSYSEHESTFEKVNKK